MANNIKEFHFRRHLLEALLVSSINEQSSSIPTINEYILSEVVNGTIDYVGGVAGKVRYNDCYNDKFVKDISVYFKEQLAGKEDKLDPLVFSSLLTMTEPYRENCPPDRSYFSTELHEHFKGNGLGICPLVSQSIISLPHGLYNRVQNSITPAFSEIVRQNLAGIGQSMRKFITEDINHIEKHYNW